MQKYWADMPEVTTRQIPCPAMGTHSPCQRAMREEAPQ